MRSWKPRRELLLLLIFNWFTQLYGQIDWKHQQELEVEVELRWIFQLVQSFYNFMALFGAKHKIYFSFLNLSSSVLKCKKLKYQLSEFCLIVSEGPTNPIIDCITETSTFTRFCRDDGQDTPGLSLALCNFISSHFSIIFLILSLSALLEEDILICKRVKILPSTSGPQRPAMVNHRNSDRI